MQTGLFVPFTLIPDPPLHSSDVSGEYLRHTLKFGINV